MHVDERRLSNHLDQLTTGRDSQILTRRDTMNSNCMMFSRSRRENNKRHSSKFAPKVKKKN